jgi:cell wall-associated NlpC family hydrolase
MRAFRFAVPFVLAALLMVGVSPPEAAAKSEAQAVLDFARSQIGKPYRFGATGLAAYDCSGFVYRAFQATGLLDLIGGKRRTARGYFNWFSERGRVTNNPRPGDVVVWGNPVSHIGIYSGTSNGHHMAISTLTSGVREHRVHGVTTRFRAYLRVNLDRNGGEAAATGSTIPAISNGSSLSVANTTMNLRRGSHTLFRLNSSGSILERRTINRSRPLRVNVDPDTRTFGGRPHAQIQSGTWSNWWRRVPQASPSCCLYRFPTTRTLRLGSGTHLFKSFHAGNTVVIRHHVRVSSPTHFTVRYRANFNGKRHFLIADGPFEGLWVVKSRNSRLVP